MTLEPPGALVVCERVRVLHELTGRNHRECWASSIVSNTDSWLTCMAYRQLLLQLYAEKLRPALILQEALC